MAPEAASDGPSGSNDILEADSVDTKISAPTRVRKVSFIENASQPKAEKEVPVTEILSNDDAGDEVVGVEEDYVPPLRRRGGHVGGFFNPYQFCRVGCMSPDVEMGARSPQEGGGGDAEGREKGRRKQSRVRNAASNPPHRLVAWVKHQLTSPVLFTRLIMMILLMVTAVVLSVGTWWATGVTYSNSVGKISSRLRLELISRIDDHLTTYLESTRVGTTTYASLLSILLRTRNLTSFTPTQLQRTVAPVAWSIFSEADKLGSSLTYAQLDGGVFSYANLYTPDGSQLESSSLFYTNGTLTSVPGSTYLAWYSQAVDSSSGRGVGPIFGIAPSAVGSYSSYIQALSGTAKGFTQGSVWDLLPLPSGPIFLCVSAVRNSAFPSPSLTGLAVSISNIALLNSYLGGVNFTGGSIFIATGEGVLVASSSGTPNYSNTSGTLTLINATDATDPVISATAVYLSRVYGTGGGALPNTSLELSGIDINGTNSYINAKPIKFDNLQLYVVVVLSRSDIMGAIDSERGTILIIEIAGAAVLILVGWVVILVLTAYVAVQTRPKEELLQQQEETQRAQAASEVKSTFLANISHDLRTPMAGILGLLDIMLCDRLTAEQEANLRSMKSCAASLLGLLNNLLDLAKVEAGKMQLEVLEFDIVGELESLVDMFSVQGLSNGTEIALDLSDDIERTVKGDSSRVRQVFANLLSNACKFTKQGHVMVRGWMKEHPPHHLADRLPPQSPQPPPPDGKRRITLIFEVDDSGPGIPHHKRELVFEKFQQADLSTNRTHGGTGLGLGIVRSLVNLMGGGSICVVDKEGPGACFRFDLTFECLDQTSEWKRTIAQPEFLLPKLSSMQGGQVMLAMKEDSAGAEIASGWMERRELSVWRVSEWEDILGTVDAMRMHRQNGEGGGGQRGARSAVGFSAPMDRGGGAGGWRKNSAFQGPLLHSTRGSPTSQWAELTQEEPARVGNAGLLEDNPDPPPRMVLAIIDAGLIPNPFQFLAEELHIFRARLQQQGVVIAWLVEHNTTAETRRALRRSGCAVASKPLYSSRMAPLLALATARKGMTAMTMGGGAGGGGGEAGLETQRNRSAQIADQWPTDDHQSYTLPGPMEGQPSVPEHQVQVATPGGTPRSGSPPPGGVPQVSTPHLARTDSEKSHGSESGAGSGIAGGGEEGEDALSALGRANLRNLSITPKRSGPPSGELNLKDVLKGYHVLIAEDTPLLKKVAIIRMQKLGCTVQAVSDGKEALDCVLANYKAELRGLPPDRSVRHFDAILMDCQMPILDGYGATAAIRETEIGTRFHTPIIALTAHAMTSDERKCLDAGMDAYLTKPIDPQLMASTILKMIGLYGKKRGGGEGGAEEEKSVEAAEGTVSAPSHTDSFNFQT